MFFFNRGYPSKYKQEVDQLTDELIQIGNTDDFLSERPGGQFDSQCRHVRARKIGERMNEIGDIRLMESLVKRISKRCGKPVGSHLEACWFRIGKF